MLGCLESPTYREMAWNALPRIIDMNEPIGVLADHVAIEGGLPGGCRPYLFPTLDDQAAGLVGGGAVDDGQVAVILGNSAVVNSSSNRMPASGSLDVMRLELGALPVDALLQQRGSIPGSDRRAETRLGCTGKVGTSSSAGM